jgi:quercetin dioxygenase-like cupin family protein
VNETLRNETTGEEVRFLRRASETGGELLVMEDRWTRPGHAVPRHCHPGMEERWTVLEGTVAYTVDGTETIARAGDSVVAPPGATHSARDAGAAEVLVRIEMRPAKRWEEFVRQLFALASEPLSDEDAASAFQELFEEFAPEIELKPDEAAETDGG